MYLTDSWYWNQNAETRAWAKRFFDKFKRMPSSLQAADYSATMFYLTAVKAIGTGAVDTTGAAVGTVTDTTKGAVGTTAGAVGGTVGTAATAVEGTAQTGVDATHATGAAVRDGASAAKNAVTGEKAAE